MPATVFNDDDFFVETSDERELRVARERLAELQVIQDGHAAERTRLLARFKALTDTAAKLKLRDGEVDPLLKRIAKANDEVKELEAKIETMTGQKVSNKFFNFRVERLICQGGCQGGCQAETSSTSRGFEPYQSSEALRGVGESEGSEEYEGDEGKWGCDDEG
jgi:hypothetical protein